MHRDARDVKAGRRGVEVFIFHAALGAAVHGVGVLCAKFLHVEMVGPLANLFVGRKGNAQPAVRRAGGGQCLQQRHNFGNAGLVVRPKQRAAVRCDKRAPAQRFHLGEIFYADGAACFGQGHVAAVVMLVKHGRHPRAAEGGGGVHMGNEAQRGRRLAAGRGRHPAVHIAEFIHMGVFGAQRRQLFTQRLCQHKLFFRRGRSARHLAGLCVIRRIAAKTFHCTHGFSSFPAPARPNAGAQGGLFFDGSTPQAPPSRQGHTPARTSPLPHRH